MINEKGSGTLFYKCDFCNKYSSSDASDLKSHMKKHINVLPLALLSRSPAKTKVKKYRDLHMNNLENTKAIFKCTDGNCNYEFVSNSGLYKHLRKFDHTKPLNPEKPLEIKILCPDDNCDFEALTRIGLQKHLDAKDPNKKMKCPDENCDFMTSTSTSLQRHLDKKDPNKKLKCHIGNCTYETYGSNHLQVHLNSKMEISHLNTIAAFSGVFNREYA